MDLLSSTGRSPVYAAVAVFLAIVVISEYR